MINEKVGILSSFEQPPTPKKGRLVQKIKVGKLLKKKLKEKHDSNEGFFQLKNEHFFSCFKRFFSKS